MQIKLPRVNSGFFLYLIFSISVYSYIYMETVNIGIYSFDYFIGWGRLFPADIGFYSESPVNIDNWNRNTLVLWIINSIDSTQLFCSTFIIMQAMIYNIYRLIYKNKLFLIFIIILNLNIFSLYPNKEYYSIISIGFFIIYIYNTCKLNLLLSLAAAAIARPEMTLLIIFSTLTINYKYKKYIFIILLIFISIFYKNLPGFENYEIVMIVGDNKNIGLAYFFNELSKDYSIYFILFPLKILMAIWESGIYYSLLLIWFTLYILKNYHDDEVLKKLIYFMFLFLLYASYPAFIHFRYISPAILALLVIAFQVRYISKAKLL